jgi:ribonuclease R
MARKFSRQVIEELNKLPPVNLSHRQPVIGFTIDAETSQDLDDAIWIEPNNTGAVISVHIADATEFIFMRSAIDAAAMERVETIYHTKTVDPMLPAELATNKISLLEGQNRPTLTIEVSLNQEADIVETKLSLTYLSSLKKFNYLQVDRILNQPQSPFFQVLRYCETWAQKLNWKRSNFGALGGTQIGGVFLSEEGKPTEVMQYRSQQIIQEFMIIANTAIASLAEQKHLPILYRNHTASAIAPEQKVIIEALSTLGMPELIRAKLSSWLNRAEYNPYVIGHFALALTCYTHFTSPIRRLADYINHRILKAVLIENKASPYTVEELKELAEHINQHKETYREKNNEFFQGKRKKQAQAALKAVDKLQNLSDKEFSQVIKNAVQTNKIAAVTPEAIRRLQANQLKPLDLYHLALAEYDNEQDEMKQVLSEYFHNHPIQATQLLQITAQRDSKKVDYIQEQYDINGFAAWCVLDNLTTINPALGKNKQEAKHGASVLWWQKFLQVNLVSVDQRNNDWQNPTEKDLINEEVTDEELEDIEPEKTG